MIEKDIDGERPETVELENQEPRFGQVGAARRVARTIFLSSTPSSVATKATIRGIDASGIFLGCLQPEQASSVYADALGRLAPGNGGPQAPLRRQNRGAKPRYRGNRLLFLAPNHGTLGRLKDAVATALAWGSIVDDVREGKLNIDLLQKNQAEQACESAQDILLRIARECYKWLLCPFQEAATDPKPMIEAFALNTTGGSLGTEIERVCLDNELVILTGSPIHLRDILQELYWKGTQIAASAVGFFEDTLRYLYLSRLKSWDALHQAIRALAQPAETSSARPTVRMGRTFEGFQLGGGDVVFNDTLLLLEPEVANSENARSLELKNADWEWWCAASSTFELFESLLNHAVPLDE